MFAAIDLSTAVTAEAMLPILANADVQNKLLPHLPEGETLPRTVAELRNTVSTPQFQQVSSCSHLIETPIRPIVHDPV